jgi:hypothetical protein
MRAAAALQFAPQTERRLRFVRLVPLNGEETFDVEPNAELKR